MRRNRALSSLAMRQTIAAFPSCRAVSKTEDMLHPLTDRQLTKAAAWLAEHLLMALARPAAKAPAFFLGLPPRRFPARSRPFAVSPCRVLRMRACDAVQRGAGWHGRMRAAALIFHNRRFAQRAERKVVVQRGRR